MTLRNEARFPKLLSINRNSLSNIVIEIFLQDLGVAYFLRSNVYREVIILQYFNFQFQFQFIKEGGPSPLWLIFKGPST